ncbi:MAG: hypothetical protein DMD38_15475, partial [Gemmatimonadetes bacterium]
MGIILRLTTLVYGEDTMKSFALITATVCLIAVPLAAQDTTLLRRPGARPGGAMVQREMGRRGDDDMMAMMREM